MFGIQMGRMGGVGQMPLAQRIAYMFSNSEPGALYDPSDLSTLFQDSAFTTPVTAVEQFVGGMLDKSGRGNHASQATSTKRFRYSRRVNLLTKTEQFDDAAWSKSTSGVSSAPVVTPNAASAPDGTMTADLVVFTLNGGTSSSDFSQLAQAPGFASGPYRWSFWAKTSDGSTKIFTTTDPAGNTILISVVGEYQQFIVTGVGSAFPRIRLRGGEGTASSASIHLWGASLTLATDSHLPYQRVNTPTDYDADPNKFPAFGVSDGVDDSFSCATGGGGNAGFFFSEVIKPLGSAGANRVLFSDAGTNTGYIVRLNTSNKLELAAGNGTAYTTIATAASLDVGAKDVVQAWDDGTNLNVKIGTGPTASIARPVVVAGTAGFTLGQDNGASTGYFNGARFGAVYRKDSSPTQAQREAVATYQRMKAKMP